MAILILLALIAVRIACWVGSIAILFLYGNVLPGWAVASLAAHVFTSAVGVIVSALKD